MKPSVHATILLLALPLCAAHAQHRYDYQDQQLRGIRGIVIQISPELGEIVDTVFQKDIVELELRRVGIKIVEFGDSLHDGTVAINVMLNPPRTAIACFVQVIQDAHLKRDPSIPSIARWITPVFISSVQPRDIRTVIEDCVKTNAKELATAYQLVNAR